MDDTILALMQEGQSTVIPYLVRILQSGFFMPPWLLAMFQVYGVRLR